MRVTITGRHFELTEALKLRIEEKLAKIERFSLRIPEANVTLAVEKYRHKAEIILHVNHSVMTSKAESDDMYVSVDSCIDKLQRMLRRYKTKHAPKPPKSGPVPVSRKEEEEDEEDFDDEE